MTDARRLQAFLYIVLRDRLTFGALEQIVHEHEVIGDVDFSEDIQAKYALTLARRILGTK